uniref:CBS domain-containing protein n=1 Tax=Neobodo designis TaxID=312471 RepID=A0A7S1M2A1_NEODS|mmetsp:Transcript_32966/g.101835  ORF Transcript_32966/g.101835 Transcript_32966/m.101835 type:complete len:410 (+) Transcript_32966:62-1291(+)|eukprot:CAMPEP_0174851462 /NCGR_PEP_ID=MMETSP1114-20130205/23202_1 /TAXON_ID=312471 /ORGANISM="Neobodo designis, Strain CCAP 1951/1" /LENGTH=409 /DNA_ID=CAMNT_0016086001 /DNA_START=61 /DNA_END=1290 /DNA_ORIENTATION=-
MESALQAALSSGGPSKAGYRRAHGAAREVLKEESGAALPPRPALDAIEPLPKQRIAALASPILSLIHDMQFYAVMGASTQVIVVDIDSPVSVAFIAATESRVSSVLLWDGNSSTFAGLLTVTDYIRVLLHCHAQGSTASDDIVGLSIRELVTRDWVKCSAPASTFVWGTPNLTVLDCLGAMIQHRVNRLPILASKVFEEEKIPDDVAMGVQPGSATATSAAPCPAPPTSYSVVSVVTFPQLLAHIGRVLLATDTGHPAGESLYDVPLKALGVGRHVASLRNGTIPRITLDNTVSDALGVMIDHNVHAVCIRGANSEIADVVTRSDVLRMETGGAYDVTQPLSEALSWRPAHASAVVCSLNDSFGDVLAHFVNTWVKEMFIVDPESDEVLGQLSMKELLQFLFDTMRESA